MGRRPVLRRTQFMGKTVNEAEDLITFSRASGGYGFTKVSYGSELVTNGMFDTDTTGSTPNTWETNSANASLIKQADGTALFTSASFAYARISNEDRPVLPVGVYWVSFEISETQGSLSNVHVGIGAVGNTISGDGTYGYAYVSSSEQAYELQIRPNSGGTGSFKIDNISVKEVTYNSSAADATLQLTYHPENKPRIEYNTDGSAKGLLIEEARTNLVTYSENFSQWSRTRLDPPTDVGGAFKIEQAPGQTNAGGVFVPDPGDYVSTYAVSFDAKAAEKEFIIIFHNSARTWFNLSTGQVGTILGAGASASIQKLEDGWYRCTVVDTSINNNLVVYVGDTDGSTTVTDSGGIFIRRAQYEQGSFPTSYIKTTGATATRSADVASIGVGEFGYSKAAGTILIEHNRLSASLGADLFMAATNSSFNPSSFGMHGSSTLTGYVRANSAYVGQVTVGATNNETTKSALSFGDSNVLGCSNGGVVSASSLSGYPTTVTEFEFMNDGVTGSKHSGHIKSIKYYPRRLTNAQLQELTT